MKFSGLIALATLLVPFAAHADSVQLGYAGGVISNPATLSPGQYSLSFTLNSDTQVSSMGLETVGFGPFGVQALDTYFATIAGPGGAVSWAPGGILAAGTYTYTAHVVSCAPLCIDLNNFLAVDQHVPTPIFPLTQLEVGGTFTPLTLSFGTGWDLVGNTVTSNLDALPEPTSIALVGTGLVAALAGLRRRFA